MAPQGSGLYAEWGGAAKATQKSRAEKTKRPDPCKKTGKYLGTSHQSNQFFDESFADQIVKFLKREKVKKIADLGCGFGQYTFHFRKNGIDCDCFDGNPDTPEITNNECKILDLSEEHDFTSPAKKGSTVQPWEYVISLEVGEHIPKEFENVFIQNLHKNNSRGIILSWAHGVGWGGHGHVNCHSNEYIKDIFYTLGYDNDLIAENFLRKSVTDSKWFKQTTMVFKKPQR